MSKELENLFTTWWDLVLRNLSIAETERRYSYTVEYLKEECNIIK